MIRKLGPFQMRVFLSLSSVSSSEKRKKKNKKKQANESFARKLEAKRKGNGKTFFSRESCPQFSHENFSTFLASRETN